MKKTLSIIYLLLLTGVVFAQIKGDTYIIKFKDKGQSAFSLSEPRNYLSERSVERRLLQEIPLDMTDIPVNINYLKEIKSNGAEVFYTSKWMNIVIAHISDVSKIETISALPFVKEIKKAKLIDTKKNQPYKRFFDQERLQQVDPKKNTGNNNSGLALDYGASANQAQMIKIDQLHNQGYTGNGVIIGVIDAGFNSVNLMDAFDSLRANNKILGTRDFVQPGNNVYNTNLSAHGTMVLSTMGGNLPGQLVGTAPHASYYLLRSEDATAEYLMEEYYWVQAAEYADSLGVDVLNTSLGYTRFDNPLENHTYADMDGNTTVITKGADLAAKKGMLVINSAGNEGGSDWMYISAPADGDSVLAIGAVDPNGFYAYFSSVGPSSDNRFKPDVATQGLNAIVAAIPSGTGMGSGTSFSSPILCGAAACLWQANPTYSNMEIFNAIKQSGSRASNPDNQIGWGIPDFVSANLLLVGNVTAENYSYQINCYPNPFSDFLIADFNINSPTNSEVRLINAQGKTIKTLKGTKLNQGSNHIKFEDLDLLQKGIYFIQVANGSYLSTQKVIK